jgi:hypothetical protein
MARSTTCDAVILEAISPVVARIAASIARDVSAMVAEQVKAALKDRAAVSQTRLPSRRQARGRVEITRWVADRRARRVPNFVKEMTGLDTKKKIVAKYGPNASFEKGKPLRAVVEKHATEPRSEVKAKGPIVRKKARAAA